MKRIYSKDTDTLLFVSSDERVVDHVDLDYQTLLDLDCDGNPVALTIEHARKRKVLSELDVEQVPALPKRDRPQTTAESAPTSARARGGPG